LLELTRDLLKRAAQNEQHPMPVVFHLSSWATKRAALADWLVEELMSKYIVPRHIAQQWVEVDHILPLLDGLDEVDEAYRSACVIAMNQYRQNHGLASMVVCCRYQDYFAQTERMMLEKAILLQPLNIQQMLDYLARAGKPLESLRHVLQTDTALQEMVTTPLMLSIMALTYQGSKVTPTIQGTLEEQRRHIFHLYIERMLARRGQKRTYSPEQTQCWLGWLARLMQEQNQTEFYVERLHPKVLPAKQQQRHYTSMVWMINGISNMILLMLFGWFRGGKTVADDGLGTGLLGQLGAPPGDAILQWMAPGVGGGLGGGATVGLIMVLIAIFSGRLIKTASY
ncbi:MAG: hypothetical protein J2P36_38680, partial [Ktedonobacteraceae bacterium]|nr:hypothetical protein [Ktedonobacteraceae bacterium]